MKEEAGVDFIQTKPVVTEKRYHVCMKVLNITLAQVVQMDSNKLTLVVGILAMIIGTDFHRLV